MSARTPTQRDAARTTPTYTREEFTAWLATSCERQGVGLTVTDPIVIAQVATLLGTHLHPRPRRHAHRGPADDRPDTSDPLHSNGLHPRGAGAPAARTA